MWGKKNKNTTVLFLEIMSVCILKTPTLVKLNETGKWDNAVSWEMQFRCVIVILATLTLSNATYGQSHLTTWQEWRHFK